ncbi:MAG TPA: opioid growth factor receptor-related protein [Kamptonema sp.]|nr:opioid growth factor receptor-related protein [Kamptonema sp.]
MNMQSDEPKLVNYPKGSILAFYLGQHPNTDGRMIEEIWSWNYEKLEEVHNYIQWLFPLVEKSHFNRSAPTLNDEIIQEFRRNENLRSRLNHSLKVILKFYGLQLNDQRSNEIEITKSDEYPQRKLEWINRFNHNYLRITRILTSLTVLGLKPYAQAFLKCLDDIYQEESDRIGSDSYTYWKKALSTN